MPICTVDNESHLLVDIADKVENADVTHLVARLRMLLTKRSHIEFIISTDSDDYRLALVIADTVADFPAKVQTSCTCYGTVNLFGLIVTAACKARRIGRSTHVILSAPACDPGTLTLKEHEEFMDQFRADHIHVVELLAKTAPAKLNKLFREIGRGYKRISADDAVAMGFFDAVGTAFPLRDDHSQAGVM